MLSIIMILLVMIMIFPVMLWKKWWWHRWWYWFKQWFIDCDNDELVDSRDKGTDCRNEDIDGVCLNDGCDHEKDDENDSNNGYKCIDDTDGKDDGLDDDSDSFSLTSFFNFVDIAIASDVCFVFPDWHIQILNIQIFTSNVFFKIFVSYQVWVTL